MWWIHYVLDVFAVGSGAFAKRQGADVRDLHGGKPYAMHRRSLCRKDAGQLSAGVRELRCQ